MVLSDEKLNSLDKNQLLYLLGSSSKLNSNYRYSLVDWNVKSIDKKDKNSLGFEISMSIALTYGFELDNNGNIKDGTGITEFLSGTITSSELGINSVNFGNKNLVQSLIEYWGFEFEESTIGFKFDVYSYSNDGSVGYYCLIDGQRYELEWGNYLDIADDGSLIFNADPNENTNSGWILNYINGKKYLASGGLNATAVYIGGELVGKTLIDYRQDALNGVYNFEKRAGESNLNLSDRFLSMFYFLCSNYSIVSTNESDKTILETDNFAKNIVKTLANVMNRPDEDLVGLEYSTDFNSYIKSENNGTVFIICTYDRSLEKYVPFLVATNNSSKKDFYSRYVVNPYGNEKLYFPVVARGIIDENGNPTSIMLDDNGDIVFYRDDIYIVNASKVGISMYYQSIEDVKVKGSVVSSIVNGITKLFSGKTLTEMIIEKIPRLSADTTLNFAYGSRTMNVAVVDNLTVIAGSVSLSRLAEVVLYTAKGKLSVNGKRYAAVYGNGDVGVNAHVPGNPVFISAFFVSRRVRCGVGYNQVNSLGNCRVLIEGNVFVQYQVARYTLVSGSQCIVQSLVEVAVYSCRVGAVRFDDSRVGNVGRNRCNVGFVDGNKFSANAVRPTVECVTVVYRCRKGVVSSAVRKTVCWYFGVGRYAAALFVAHACGNGVLLAYKTHVCNGECVFVGFAVIKGTSRIADVNVVHVASRNVGVDGYLPTHPAHVAGCFVVKSFAFGCFVLVVTFHQFGAEVSHVGVVSRNAYVGSSRASSEG